MEQNELIDFILERPNIFKVIYFYYNFLKANITGDSLYMFFNFLECIERMFYYDNSINSPICCAEERGHKYIILNNKVSQIYISPRDDGDMFIRIYRHKGKMIDSKIIFNYNEFDKVTKYDKYIIQQIFKELKMNIFELIKKYINEV